MRAWRPLRFSRQNSLSIRATRSGPESHRGTIPEALFWDTREPYDYLRIDRHRDFDYVVYGGEDHKTGQKKKTQKAYVRLWRRLKRIIPEARVDHRWSGQVISTPDGLPYIGENAERQFIATGFCGNGITFGTVAAMMARDWSRRTKKSMDRAVCRGSKKIKGAAWNYLRENKDYPYYMIKDRLARPEADFGTAAKTWRRNDCRLSAGRRLLPSATLTGTSVSSRLFAHTLAVLSGGTRLNRRGIVLVTAHVSNLPVK